MRTPRTDIQASFALAALIAAGLTAAACHGTAATGSTSSASSAASTSSSSSGSGGSGGAGPASFTPQGCAFSIAARPEYTGFQAAPQKVGATPNIRRVRLGLGGNVAPGVAGHADPSSSIGVAWQTDADTLVSELAWGAGPDASKWPAAQRVSGVTWLTPHGNLTNLDDERMHEAYLCGLEAATTYYYRAGGGPAGGEVWSDVYPFTTTPKAGPTKVTFGVTGDSRGENNDAWRVLQRRMSTLSPTLLLFSGDMVNYATDQTAWEHWLDSAWRDSDQKPLTLAQILTLSTHGNHENHTALFFGNVVLPQDVAAFPKYGELFYSVDVGPVHLVVLDDFWVTSPADVPEYGGVLSAWLAADLGAANKNRKNVPWIITMHHHGEFSSSDHGTDLDTLRGRRFFVPIWDKYHVDLDLAGHDHNYERSRPLTGPLAADDSPMVQASFASGTVYVVCAGSGADPYASGTSAFTQTSHEYTSGGAIGLYGILTVDATSLKLDAHELRADQTDPIIDALAITKP